MNISDFEFDRIMKRMEESFTSGKYQEVVDLATKILKSYSFQDIRRSEITSNLSRALVRLGRFPEALEYVHEAIKIAHQHKDVLWLVMMLDLRAEIFCFSHQHLKALKSLAAADHYYREGNINNNFIEGWLSHTKALVFQRCGWWERGKTEFEKSIKIMEFEREWNEYARTIADFAVMVLNQTSSDGVDYTLLRTALEKIYSAQEYFLLYSNLDLLVLSSIHKLRLKTILATLDKNTDILRQIRDDFLRLRQEYNSFLQPSKWTNLIAYLSLLLSPSSLALRRIAMQLFLTNYLQPSNFNAFRDWSIGICRVERALIDFQVFNLNGESLLEAQHQRLTQQLEEMPNLALLWFEKAALYLCYSKINNSINFLFQSSCCIEHVMDSFWSLQQQYTESQVRAGWLNQNNYILEVIVEIANLALEYNITNIAWRMINFAQYFRVHSQPDLIRNLNSIRAKDLDDIETILTRIRYLRRWEDRILAVSNYSQISNNIDLVPTPPRKFSDSNINQPTQQELSKLLNQVSSGIIEKYPEYKIFTNHEIEIKYELKKQKEQLESRILQGTLLKAPLTFIEEKEAPSNILDLQPNLKEGEFVLDYYLGSYKVQVGIISNSKLKVLSLPLENVRQLHKTARINLFNKSIPLAAIMKNFSQWLFPDTLVDFLIKNQAKRLYIVVTNSLCFVPFAWLNARGKVALERWEIALVPNAKSAGCNCYFDPSFKTYVIGHSGSHSTPLPDIQITVNQIANLLNSETLLDEEATPQKIINQVLENADLIDFICHGDSDSISPLMSYLLLEPEQQHPDGRLLLQDFLTTNIKAKIISLGACYTAKHKGQMSFPESLAHVLLGSGVKFITASLWEAKYTLCTNFHYDFYSCLIQILEPITAFNQAQKHQLQSIPCYSGCNYYHLLTDKNFQEYANFICLSTK